MPAVSPFVWADSAAFTVSGSSGNTIDTDVLTIPPGFTFAGSPVLLLGLNGEVATLTSPSTPSFSVRFPDSTFIPIPLHLSATLILPYETASSRFVEGGVIVCTAPLHSSGTSDNLLVAALVGIPGASELGFTTPGLFMPSSIVSTTVFSGSASVTRTFSSVTRGEPLGHVSVSWLGVLGSDFDALGNRVPHDVTSVPTWQSGNIGTWTDILVATHQDKQVALGLYAATAAGQSRSFSITNLQTFPPSTFGSFVQIATSNTVFLPSALGRSYAQVVT